MSKNILDKKIPSLAGLGIIAIGIAFTTFLVKGPTPFQIKAGPQNQPKNIQVTNVSDASFSVIYTTDDTVSGTIAYGTDPEKLDQIALDERDQLSQKVSEYQAHSITAINLTPNTNYYFVINSGKEKIENEGTPFIVKTGSNISTPPTAQIPIAGTIQDPSGGLISDGLVVITISGAQKISGLIRGNGDYTIPINNLRTSDLGSYYLIDDSSVISLTTTSNGKVSKATVSKNQLSPVPFITLSKNYNFSEPKANKPRVINREDISFPDLESEIEEVSPPPEDVEET